MLTALDGSFELAGHGIDDALAHAGGARIDFHVEADAIVSDRQFELVALRGEHDMDRAGAVGIGIFDGVHHQLVDDDADGHGAVRVDLDGLSFQRQARHPVAFGRATEIFQQGFQILIEQHAVEVVRGVQPAMDLRHGGDTAHGVGQRYLDVIFTG